MSLAYPQAYRQPRRSPFSSVSHRAISIANRNGVPKTSTRGSHVCSVGKPHIMYFESSLEKWMQLCSFARRGTAEVREQQRVDYIDVSGRPSRHWFDLLLRTVSGETIAIAIKPSRVAERTGFRSLLELIAEQTPKSFADRVVLATERSLTRDLVYNAELIHSARLDAEPDCDAVVRAQYGELDAPLDIAAFSRRCGIGGSAFRSVVRLIAAGEIQVPDRHYRITPALVISQPSNMEARS